MLKQLGYTYDDVKVNGMILCYPVLTLKEFTHEGSKLNLIGDDQELSEHLSMKIVLIVKLLEPLFGTLIMMIVPMENALIMANALRVNKIPFELHIYEEGPHGLSVSDETSAHDGDDYYINKDVSSWVNLCANWIKQGTKIKDNKNTSNCSGQYFYYLFKAYIDILYSVNLVVKSLQTSLNFLYHFWILNKIPSLLFPLTP